MTTLLRGREPQGAEAFVLKKVEHYGFKDRRKATRMGTRLREIGRHTPPKVWAATFAFVNNRWSTGTPVLLSRVRGGR